MTVKTVAPCQQTGRRGYNETLAGAVWVIALRRWDAPPGVFAAAVVFGAVLIIHAAVVQSSTIHVFPQHEIPPE